MGYWPIVLNILKNSDVVVLVVDARMPEVTRNSEIIDKVKKMKKEPIIVFNKFDLVGKKEQNNLKTKYGDSFFVSSTKKIGIKDLKSYLVDLSENYKRSSLRVGVVGYPNVGKSSLINLLVPKANAKISKISGTTKKTGWFRDGRIRIMDSPGVIPFGDADSQLGLSASKDPHKIRNPEKVALRIIEYLEGRNVLEKFYGIKQSKGWDTFLAIGGKKGFLIKGGEIDENRTAIKIISDWQSGKIKLK